MFSMMVRLVSLSSATSTFSVGIATPSCSPGVVSAASPQRIGRRKMNSEPTPGALRASMRPPINSTSCFEIANPSPVPP